ncbi:uncharacterized protein F4807DRAFT_437491 [Annulohypoxylon truncatum]|uniref:uncharacterized protein n=1 Tax=Annulohypoxylon truncatum TaxID=327061 RepID=UPI002007766F|nr:uncharacterized protein F4807DRAFT_437491 [Annulohypoxylon truncatum]KAI1206861.1 hypothetical protein F4807DRAFT_437491 [Annulohypoxylon truncatum]
MAGILGSYSDSTCNTHNALQNISEYACGVTFQFKSSDNPPDMHYAVVSLQKCCAKANQPVMRIPGNTGCEMQFCELPAVTSSYTSTILYGGATQTAAPTVTQGAEISWPSDVESCMAFVYEGDLPDDIAKDISNAGNWCVARMYDDELPSSDVSAAVTASPAPASWTSAAADPFANAFSSKSSSSTSTAASSTSTSNGCSVYADQRKAGGMGVWTVVVLISASLVAAL